MHRIAAVIAHLVVRRPMVMAIAGLLLAAGSVAIISSQKAFDSDILNLLPANNPAVQGLKIYNSEFTQARELAFLLTWEKAPADGDAFRETFVERLRSQPWVHRVLDAPPLEASGGRKSIHEILVPLLLNLPAEQFADAINDLSPEAIQESDRPARGANGGRLAASTVRARERSAWLSGACCQAGLGDRRDLRDLQSYLCRRDDDDHSRDYESESIYQPKRAAQPCGKCVNSSAEIKR